MIRFTDDADGTLLEYSPSFMDDRMLAKLGIEVGADGSIAKRPQSGLPPHTERVRPSSLDGPSVTVKRVFTFLRDDLVVNSCDDQTLVFRFATRSGGYRVVPGRVFGIPQDVLIGTSVKLDWRMFCVGYEHRTSVMRKISRLVDLEESRIVIGGDADNAIPLDAYGELLDEFPTTSELERYGDALIESYVQDYLATRKDYRAEYESRYRSRRQQAFDSLGLGSRALDPSRLDTLVSTQAILEEMLAREAKVPEEAWQRNILAILPTLFPQYIAVFPKARVRDVVNGKDREIDFLLVDAAGCVDVLEIKRAFGKRRLIMKTRYRDNYVPARELSGGVAQIEKYIYYLHNWGPEGERKLTERYRKLLPAGVKLRFVNPRGLLLLGHCALDADEQRDFEIIRRQYSHVVDIITYDDLLSRLSRMVEAVSSRQ